MLTTLKEIIRNDVEFGTSLESAMEHISESGDDIKDVFLDDPDAMVIGAENDPEIAKLVNSLPDDVNEEVNDITEKDIADIVEGFVPMSFIPTMEDVDGSAEDGDPGDNDEDEPYEDMSDVDTGEDQDDIEDAPDDDPIEEGIDDIDVDFDNLLESDSEDDDSDSEDSDDDDDDDDKKSKKKSAKKDSEDDDSDPEDSDDDDDNDDKKSKKKSAKKDSEDDNTVEEDFTDIDFAELTEADFENILADKQNEAEDASDKAPSKSTPYNKNIDGEDQDDIEDAPDKCPVKSTPYNKNIDGEDQDDIEDVREGYTEFDIDDDFDVMFQ